jgi:hypothetical protein
MAIEIAITIEMARAVEIAIVIAKESERGRECEREKSISER